MNTLFEQNLNQGWEFIGQGMTRIANELTNLPDGLRATLFDWTLREYNAAFSYVGKIYSITSHGYEEESSRNVGDAFYVAVFDADREFCCIASDYETYSLEAENDLQMFSNFNSLPQRFLTDLGPLVKLFSLREVQNAIIGE